MTIFNKKTDRALRASRAALNWKLESQAALDFSAFQPRIEQALGGRSDLARQKTVSPSNYL
jgi:hypothetical protein